MSKTSAQLEQERREDTAAAVVASVVGARFRRRDTGGQQMDDFDLEFDDGAVEALEVPPSLMGPSASSGRSSVNSMSSPCS